MTNTENRWAQAQAAARSCAWLRERIDYLEGFVTPERAATLRSRLQMRTRYLSVCMENTFHPQNASALVRHCDAFGVQDIHAVESLCRFNPNTNIVRGTDKWTDLHRYPSSREAIRALRSAGYRIVATTPHRGDTTPECFDVRKGPFVLLFGTEHAGISEEAASSADEFVRIPMCGFVESLNVSASAAILIYLLASRVRTQVADWRLQEREQEALLFRWLLETLRDPIGILSRRFPDTTYPQTATP